MKKIIRTVLASVLLAGLASCDLETSDNGRLDGFWLLTTVDTLSTGGVSDVREEGLTWSFQGRLLELREATLSPRFVNILCRFEYTKTQLSVSSPVYVDRDHNDPDVESVEDLQRFGVNSLEETFDVVSLTHSKMVLRSDGLQLNFRKY
ncbi:MAG: lipocalin-like domain-containing protein [Prevotella sp.]|nr:lipocalin-like domain-containing protein [Prevotella sp.]